jgi:hypothetical protein
VDVSAVWGAQPFFGWPNHTRRLNYLRVARVYPSREE